jgi:hypothetical protein
MVLVFLIPMLANYDLINLRFKDGSLDGYIGVSPEEREKRNKAQAEQQKAAFLRASQQPRRELSAKIVGKWRGEYRFSDTLAREVRSQYYCQFKGGEYVLDVKDYEVEQNTGFASLQVRIRNFDSDDEGYSSCNPDRVTRKPESKLYPYLIFHVSYEIDASLKNLPIRLVQERCIDSCLELGASVEVERNSSNRLIYRGPDLLFCCNTANLTLLLDRLVEPERRRAH